jgi:hypothetical protein
VDPDKQARSDYFLQTTGAIKIAKEMIFQTTVVPDIETTKILST